MNIPKCSTLIMISALLRTDVLANWPRNKPFRLGRSFAESYLKTSVPQHEFQPDAQTGVIDCKAFAMFEIECKKVIDQP
jgi:hypothetical protein